ncbi:hymenoptaecin [Bombus terrestris]|uniref:Hymenoptaecin n=5 Tax=Bombus TaxID=144708 RepID=A0A9C6VWT2_BOMTE|nr:hymenoptaecin [Bombus terrestris]
MKFIVLALFCMAAYAAAQEIEPEAVEEYYGSPRFRRHADPQGSLVIDGKKPLSGPDRRPSLDVDYHQRVYDRNGVNADAYGGLNIRPGQPAQPHLGVQIQREYKNGFIRGYSQAERGPGGRISPSFGVGGGFRF